MWSARWDTTAMRIDAPLSLDLSPIVRAPAPRVEGGILGIASKHGHEVRMRVLITGVTGQAGHYLARRLLEAGHEVIGTTRNLDGVSAAAARSTLPGLRFVQLEIADASAVE